MSDAQTTEGAEAGAAGEEEAADLDTGAPADRATTAADGPAPGPRRDDPEKERLDQVGERIQRAAQQADEAMGEPGQQKFVESGDERSQRADDQTIAPPG